MPESPATLMDKPLPGAPPGGRAARLRKAMSSQALQLSPEPTSSRPSEIDRAEWRGSLPALEDFVQREPRGLRHSSSTISRATVSSSLTSTSGGGTIVGLSKDVSANRTVGSGHNSSLRDSQADPPNRTPLAVISSRASRNVLPSSSSALSGQENTTPVKTSYANSSITNMYTSLRPPNDGLEAHTSPPVLPQLRKLQRQLHSLKAENNDLRAIKIAHTAEAADLRGQLQAKDDEHARLVEQHCRELAARDRQAARMRENATALKKDKCALLGRVAELEVELQRAVVSKQSPVLAGSPRAPSGGCLGGERNDIPGSSYSFGGQDEPPRSLHRASSSVADASLRSYVRRRPSLAESSLTAAELAEDELDILSDQLVAHQEQYYKEFQALTAHVSELVDELAAAQDQRDEAEGRNRELETKLASQATLVYPIPDLPVLTYTTIGSVWFDTVVSSFKYWGLFEFISQPDESLFAGNEPDRECRRLRALVLLKHAIDDDILDDVMYLQKQGSISAPSHNMTPAIESPYFLFNTVATLKRTVPNSLTDFGWLDRISDDDFTGIEGFASLVNILNRRQSQLYGTSADHYDALVPRIQESMARRFPDLERSLMDPSSAPKKWWHLALWMSRVVKRRQGRITGLEDS